ncbi:MAG: LytTR family DNA-binding domain-containing protein [Bacteroidota bacterium]
MGKKIKSIWLKEYPQAETLNDEVKGLLIAAFIVSFILFVFRPFGLHNYKGSMLWIALCFGGITFAVGLILNLIFIAYYKFLGKRRTYRFGNWIVESIILIIAIALANLLFMRWGLDQRWSLEAYFMMLLNTFLIGIFPLAFFGLINQNKSQKKNENSAKDLNTGIASIDINKPSISSIFAIESMQNYIHIYRKTHGGFEKEIERSTLSSALEKYSTEGLIRCHRSFLVNPNMIKSVSGNAQGLKLTLVHEECPIIPVSRSYISKVKENVMHVPAA